MISPAVPQGAEMTQREKVRDLGNQAARLSQGMADLLTDALDALERTEAELAATRVRCDQQERNLEAALAAAEKATGLATLYGQAIIDIHEIPDLPIRIRLICAGLDTSAASLVEAEGE